MRDEMTKPAMAEAHICGREELEASGWSPAKASRFMNHVGPLWRKDEDGRMRFGILVEPQHDNTQGRPHGGMIMTLCDDAMGNHAQAQRPGERLFTVSFDCQFIGAASEGEFVEARCEVVKATRSLIFMRSTCFVGGRTIAAASGIWKAVGK